MRKSQQRFEEVVVSVVQRSVHLHLPGLAPHAVLEQEITGVEAPNVNLIFDFGKNPAGTVIYIKDIILAEV